MGSLCAIPKGLYNGTPLGGTTRGTLESYPGRVLSQKSKASPTDTSNSISDTIRELSGQSEKRKNFYEEQKLQLLKEQS